MANLQKVGPAISKPLENKMREIQKNNQLVKQQTEQFKSNLGKLEKSTNLAATISATADNSVKETGDVQHRAEMVESQLRRIEETLELAKRNRGA